MEFLRDYGGEDTEISAKNKRNFHLQHPKEGFPGGFPVGEPRVTTIPDVASQEYRNNSGILFLGVFLRGITTDNSLSLGY